MQKVYHLYFICQENSNFEIHLPKGKCPKHPTIYNMKKPIFAPIFIVSCAIFIATFFYSCSQKANENQSENQSENMKNDSIAKALLKKKGSAKHCLSFL